MNRKTIWMRHMLTQPLSLRSPPSDPHGPGFCPGNGCKFQPGSELVDTGMSQELCAQKLNSGSTPFLEKFIWVCLKGCCQVGNCHLKIRHLGVCTFGECKRTYPRTMEADSGHMQFGRFQRVLQRKIETVCPC